MKVRNISIILKVNIFCRRINLDKISIFYYYISNDLQKKGRDVQEKITPSQFKKIQISNFLMQNAINSLNSNNLYLPTKYTNY